jgi:hypothetical protein
LKKAIGWDGQISSRDAMIDSQFEQPPNAENVTVGLAGHHGPKVSGQFLAGQVGYGHATEVPSVGTGVE